MKGNKQKLQTAEQQEILKTLKARFEKNMQRHKGLNWTSVATRITAAPAKLWSLYQMESTGGEPDVVGVDKKSGEIIFYDCSPESPKDRRSFCYDRKALDARKEHKPKNSAMDMAEAMGVEILTKEEYLALHELGKFDSKTSSWVKTPDNIRKLGGALFGDFRYDTVFFYHNGAESYYAARGFRTVLKV